MGNIYLIPDAEQIEESLELAKQYHAYFEYNDFYEPAVLDDEKKIEERIAFYRKLERDRSQDTLHGAFLDITVHSEDTAIRSASEHRVRQCMEIARRLEIRGVVFHTNFIPNFRTDAYRKNWAEANERFWRQILKEYPGLSVFIENMFDEEPETLAALAEKMQDEERFGVCFDYAHAQVFGHAQEFGYAQTSENAQVSLDVHQQKSVHTIGDWVNCLKAYIRHMHINDNDLIGDLHQSVGYGKIDWKQFTEQMKEAGLDSTVLIEVKDLKKQKESLEYMQQNRIYPYL